MAIVGLSWHNYAGPNQLDPLTPGGSVRATGASGTTGIVIGYASNGTTNKAVQWSGASVTALTDPYTAQESRARIISDDGSVIVGWFNASVFHPTRWTSNGTVATELSPGTGYTNAYISGSFMSADGGKIVGASQSGGPFSGQATLWTGTTPSLIPFNDANPLNNSVGITISADGSTYSGTFANGSFAKGWVSTGASLSLLIPLQNPQTESCNIGSLLADGSVVFGGSGGTFLYWDSLATTTVISGVTYYGVVNTHQPPPGGSVVRVAAMAQNLVGGSPFFVGQVNTVDGKSPAATWSGTTCTTLALLSGGTDAAAVGVSADGSVIVGYAYDSDGAKWPVYWDGSGIHKLPTIADVGDLYQGEVFGVSADGTWIFGQGDEPTASPPGIPTDLACL